MGLESLIKREIKITIFIVLLVSTSFFAFSYALFKVEDEGENTALEFGDIKLSFCQDSTCNEYITNPSNIIGTTLSGGITSYVPVYPIENVTILNDGSTNANLYNERPTDYSTLTPYTFTLRNDGTTDLYVSIKLEKDTTADLSYTVNNVVYNQFLDENQVMIAIGESGSTPTSMLYSSTDDGTGVHVIMNNITITPGASKTFNLYIWLRSDAQNSDQGKYFVSNISAIGEFVPKIRTLKVAMLEDNTTVQTVSSDDMFEDLADSTQNGLWSESRSGKTEDGETVYFYRGAVQNNWVYFAGFYWRIIRTNEDDSVRLLYAGTTHNTTTGYINETTYAFNTSDDNAKYVGYMYGTGGSQDLDRTNQENLSTAASTINNWYKEKILDNNYSSYINADAVYCVDRNAYDSSGNTYSDTWSSSTKYYFGAYDRLSRQKTPTYVCSNASDKFTSTSSTVGVKKLTYPVALMTADELAYAGGVYGSSYSSNYPWYYTNSAGGSIVDSSYWWLLSPYSWDGDYSRADVFCVIGSSYPAYLSIGYVDYALGLRPTITVKSCALATGHGTATDPYVLSVDSICASSNN